MSWQPLVARAKLEFHITLIRLTFDPLSEGEKKILMHLCIESIVKMIHILTKTSLGMEGSAKGRIGTSKRTGKFSRSVQT